MTQSFFLSLVLIAALTSVAGCKSGGSDPSRPMLRLSMIPNNDPGKMLRDSDPLVAYLEKETGAKVRMTIPTNYAAVVEAIANDQVDIAYLGGFTYVQTSSSDHIPTDRTGKILVQRRGQP